MEMARIANELDATSWHDYRHPYRIPMKGPALTRFVNLEKRFAKYYRRYPTLQPIDLENPTTYRAFWNWCSFQIQVEELGGTHDSEKVLQEAGNIAMRLSRYKALPSKEEIEQHRFGAYRSWAARYISVPPTLQRKSLWIANQIVAIGHTSDWETSLREKTELGARLRARLYALEFVSRDCLHVLSKGEATGNRSDGRISEEIVDMESLHNAIGDCIQRVMNFDGWKDRLLMAAGLVVQRQTFSPTTTLGAPRKYPGLFEFTLERRSRVPPEKYKAIAAEWNKREGVNHIEPENLAKNFQRWSKDRS